MQPLYQPIVEFGPCLRQILEEKGVSASELARLMNYKSRNTVFRILAGECSYSVLGAFCARLLDENPMALSQEERSALVQALDVSRVGVQRYQSFCALHELLGAMEAGNGESSPEAGDVMLDIGAIEAVLRGCREVSATITGCCDRKLFDSFSRALRAVKGQVRLSIQHFIYTGSEEVIRNISAIQPLLYEPCYTPYALEPGMFSPEREQLYRSNCVFLDMVNEAGERFEQVFLLVDKGVFCPMGRRAPGGFRLLQTVFGEDTLLMHPLKKSFATAKGPQAYVDYILECEKLEHGRTICNIRPDVPISFIHPDLLVSAVMEGFRDKGFADAAELEAILPPMYEGQLRRYNNFFEKRRPTHTILIRSAMERFARTGEQSDHFFAMRPYTREERIRILENLRGQIAKNRNFRLYFFREDYVPPQMEIGLYDGVGVLFAKPHTDYNLAGTHAEAIIDQQAFCARFRDFFEQCLLKKYVTSEAETLDMLDELIRTAEQAQ